jgi:hypothetical protein
METRTNAKQIWKFDKHGNERPLKEQISRRKEDLRITQDHIAWYNKNPLHKNEIKRAIAQKRRREHLEDIIKDINLLEKKLQ